MTTSAWEELSAVIAAAPYPVSVLAADSGRVAACMSGLAVSTRSWLGTLVANTGGLLGYSVWLHAMLTGMLDGFYETLRWPGEQQEDR